MSGTLREICHIGMPLLLSSDGAIVHVANGVFVKFWPFFGHFGARAAISFRERGKCAQICTYSKSLGVGDVFKHIERVIWFCGSFAMVVARWWGSGVKRQS